MIISWGLMLPSGVISARFLKHRKDALWFKIHSKLQPFGLLIAIIGWGIALARFDVFSNGPKLSLMHGSLGMLTMVLGIMQPINAFFRPHVAKDHPKTFNRLCWEYLHKGSGYTAICTGMITVSLGCLLASSVNLPGLGIAWACVVVGLVSFILWAILDKKREMVGMDIVQNASGAVELQN